MLSYFKQHLMLTLSILLLSTLADGMIHDPRAIEVDPSTASTAIAPRLDGLGDYGFEVSTSNAESQFFFSQGLRLTFAFNHSEALRSFKEAVRLDPNNAMAYWGWALVLGPNLNLSMQEAVGEQAFDAVHPKLGRRPT